MARIRTIKPEFWQSATLARLEPVVVLTFVGLLNHLDDAGRCKDRPALVKAAVHPLREEITTADVATHLAALVQAGALCRFDVDGESFIHAPYFRKNQRIDKPTGSTVPPCPIHEPATQSVTRAEALTGTRPGAVSEGSTDIRGSLRDSSVTPIRALPLEGKGGEQEKEVGAETALPTPLPPPPLEDELASVVDELVAVYEGIVPSPPADRVAVLKEQVRGLLFGGADYARLRQAVVELAGKDIHPMSLGKFLEQVRMPSIVSPVSRLTTKSEQQWKAGF
jgi:hypothetical protein